MSLQSASDQIVTKNSENIVPTSNLSIVKWKCLKCGCESYKEGEIRVCGGFFAKIFNLQTRKFSTITCELCGFTELYERYQNPISNILDIIVR